MVSARQKFWTGSKRVGHNEFVDENGMPIENLGCFFNQNAREGSKEDIFKFPSEVTAVLLEEQVVWENSVPGMLVSSDTELYSYELFRTPTKRSVPLLHNLH